MFEPWEFLVLCLLGGVGGLMSGLLGVGGGVIFIPILDYYLKSKGLDPDAQVKFILASSLFAIIFSGLVISLKQYRMGNFFPKAIIATALPGVFSSIAMTWFIESGNWYQKDAFNLVFIALLVPLMLRMFSQRKNEGQSEEKPFPSNFTFGVTGFLTGIVTSLSGLGGGIVMVPVFSDFYKMSIKKATSISTGVIPFFALPIGLFYAFSQAPVQLSTYQTGYIIYPLILPLIIGVLLVAPYGVKLSHQLKPFWIKTIFALVMLIVLTSRCMQLPFFN